MTCLGPPVLPNDMIDALTPTGPLTIGPINTKVRGRPLNCTVFLFAQHANGRRPIYSSLLPLGDCHKEVTRYLFQLAPPTHRYLYFNGGPLRPCAHYQGGKL